MYGHPVPDAQYSPALAGCGQKGDLVFNDPDTSKNAKATSVSSNYDSIRANIFVPKCISCHDEGAASPHGIDLTTYENILDQSMFPEILIWAMLLPLG